MAQIHPFLITTFRAFTTSVRELKTKENIGVRFLKEMRTRFLSFSDLYFWTCNSAVTYVKYLISVDIWFCFHLICNLITYTCIFSLKSSEINKIRKTLYVVWALPLDKLSSVIGKQRLIQRTPLLLGTLKVFLINSLVFILFLRHVVL